MSDIDINELSNQIGIQYEKVMGQYQYKKGTQFLNVVLGEKDLKNSISSIAKSLKDSNEIEKEALSTNNKLINALNKNAEANKNKSTEKDKKDKDNNNKLEYAFQQVVAGISKFAGMIDTLKKSEVTLYKNLSESNANYTDSLTKIGNYATNFGMKNEEFVKMLSENAKEFNTIQNYVGDV